MKPSSTHYELPDTLEAIEFYYEQGLTDGLPIIPPTPARVQQLLHYAGLPPEEVIGTRTSRNWIITAEKAAINAVMAGCLPEYMPVVVAAVEAYCDPDFNGSAITESSGNAAPLLVVNGPIRHQLNVNSGCNLFGPGWRANATIGRAIRLILINVCGEVPGVTDKSTFGQPGKFTSCIAEAEEVSPWEPLHVERGFPPEDSAVTVIAAEPLITVSSHGPDSPEQLLDAIGDVMASLIYGFGQILVILGPEHLTSIVPFNWSKAQVKEYLLKRAQDRRPAMLPWSHRDLARLWGIAEEAVPKGLGPAQDILVMVGGGAGGYSAVVPVWGGGWRVGRAVTKRIRTPMRE